MRTMSDWELVQEYAKSRSEQAFAELVRRHLAWVYSVALRRTGRPELAEEVAQSVFILLARKAGQPSFRNPCGRLAFSHGRLRGQPRVAVGTATKSP